MEELPRRGTILLGTGTLDARSCTCHRRRPTRDTRAHDRHELLDAAIVLSRASRLEVYNIGGTVSPITRAQEGDWAVREMERLP